MRRSRTISLAEAMEEYIKEMKIGPGLKEISIINSWESVVGKAISSRTSRIYIKDSILFVHLNSPVVKSELLMLREALREKLNAQAGEEIIKEIVLK